MPKTLIYAKDDSHADDIVKIVREEFGKGNDFAQKITYKTTGRKPEDLLASFRNSYDPRVVVTVDMIATGTPTGAGDPVKQHVRANRGPPGEGYGPAPVSTPERARATSTDVSGPYACDSDRRRSSPLSGTCTQSGRLFSS